MHRFNTLLSTRIALAMLLMLAVAAYAQDGPPRDGPPPDMDQMQRQSPKEAAAQDLRRLSKQLKLTNDQKSAILPILQDQHERMRSLFQDQSGFSEDKMEKMKGIWESAKNKIRALLTEDQKVEFAKIAEKMEQRPPSPPE